MYAFSNTKRVDGGVVPSTINGRGSHTDINFYNILSQAVPGVNNENKATLERAGIDSSTFEGEKQNSIQNLTQERVNKITVEDVKKVQSIPRKSNIT